MSQTLIARRGLLAMGASLVLAPAASVAQDIPRMDPARCVGQPEIKPLQPLKIITPKGPVNLMVEYADTEKKRNYGLMCRKSLAADRGMLFDFDPPRPVAFWMRNTLIPLDLIYIRPDGRVLSIARNAQPHDERGLPSGGVIRAVLEVAAGRAAQIGVLPGDRIEHAIFKKG